LKKELFDKASSIVKVDLLDICEKGPQEKLTSTDIAQPALFVVSAIHCPFSKSKNVIPEVVAAQSLGEYSALFSAGVFSFEDGIRLTQKRGSLMENVSQRLPARMPAVVGLESEKGNTLILRHKKLALLFVRTSTLLTRLSCQGYKNNRSSYTYSQEFRSTLCEVA